MVQRTWFTLIILPYTGFLFHSIDYTRICRDENTYVVEQISYGSLSSALEACRQAKRLYRSPFPFDELHVSSRLLPAGRAESWVQDYTARLALHRDQIRAETNKLDWLFATHATDRSAAELLLFLHAGMQVSKSGARTTTIEAGPAA
jgi:uncharacterized protein (DUF58 family)